MSYICVIKTKNINKDISITINSFNGAIEYINSFIDEHPAFYIKEALILEETSNQNCLGVGFDFPNLIASIRTVR